MDPNEYMVELMGDRYNAEWANKAISHTSNIFRLQELVHYATPGDIAVGNFVARDFEMELLVERHEYFMANERVRYPNSEELLGKRYKNTKCPKCKSEQVIMRQVQNRSNDEDTSIYFDCYKCKFSFRG